MTDTSAPSDAPAPGSSDEGCAADPHDHTGHDHPPTGADLVHDLVRALSVVALVIPVLAVAMLLAVLPFAPSTPLVLALGLGLGAAHLASLVVTSVYVSRTRRQLSVNPGLLTVRSTVEEVLRVAATLLAVLLWPADGRAELGVWVGAGCALVWMVLATVQTVATRRRLSRPSAWATDAVATLLDQRVDARSTAVMRVLDVIGSAAFQIGATVLVILSPVLVIGTAVLSIGSGLSTLVLQRRTPSERVRSPWAFVPLGVGLLALALAALGIVSL